MLRHFFFIIILSILIVLSSQYLQIGFSWLMDAYVWFNNQLKTVFSGGALGMLIRQTLALIVIPLVFTAIPATVYWMLKRQSMPNVVTVAWVCWAVLAILITQAG